MRKYFYSEGHNKLGPFSLEEMKKEELTRETKVWYYGLDSWVFLSEVEELSLLNRSIPPPLPSQTSLNKSKAQDIRLNLANEPSIKPKPLKELKSKSNGIKNVVIIAVVGIMGFIIFAITKESPEEKNYERIVSSSYESDVDFDFYLNKFYRDIKYYGIFPQRPKTTIIKLANLDQIKGLSHLHGVSYGYENDDIIEIYINTSSWESFNKQKRYYLMYHELAHDLLNVDDLKDLTVNEGKLMYPTISSYEKITMDDFIESTHALFEEIVLKQE